MSERPSLLIVDDEAAILESLRILFKNEGFDVTVAQGGRAALEALERATPEIVLTDVRMPSVSGIDILTAARQRDADLPVVLMTAQAELKTAIQAVNQGAFHYIQKPFENDELVVDLPARGGAPEAQDRESGAEAGDPAARAHPGRQADRRLEVVPGGDAPGRDRGAHRQHRADPGRERHGQGGDRPLHPRAVRARPARRSSRSTAARCPRASSSRSCSAT